jgi:hypothetical protein
MKAFFALIAAARLAALAARAGDIDAVERIVAAA